MDADRINAQAQSGNPAEANAEANHAEASAEQKQSRREARMLRVLEVCLAETIRAEAVENYGYIEESTLSRTIQREYHLSDEILDYFYEKASELGAIQRTERADGITVKATDGYEPFTYPISRDGIAVTERGDYPVSYGSAAPTLTPAVIFPESTKPANLCYDPQPKVKEVDHTGRKAYKDEIDYWREDHHHRRKTNLRIIAKTADWNRQPTDFHADPLAGIRGMIEAQSRSGQARKNNERAEKRAARKRPAARRKVEAESTRDLPGEDDGYVIPGCGMAADEADDDQHEQGFIPSVLDSMAAASYTEDWDS